MHSLHLRIASANPATVDGLQDYLGRIGVRAQGATDITGLGKDLAAEMQVVILFPDDFPFATVSAEVTTLRRGRKDVLVVLVTSEPRRYETLPEVAGGYVPLVIPKPAWGWTILESIRARLDAGPLA